MRAAQKLLGASTIGGGSTWAGVLVEGVKGVKYVPLPPGLYKNGENTGGFTHFWLLNCRKRRFSFKSTLLDIFPRRFLRNTLIVRFLVTSGILVISVQSFGSHIRPQAPGLGFITY